MKFPLLSYPVDSISQTFVILLQVEEEEYTSRVIQYFSTGLLTLPDGATLRSYLADKLNCDPMRITKKFTGACCLGRRVYHLRDRQQALPAEIKMAQAELDHLEHRFRMRVEHDNSGFPMARRQELLFAQPERGVNNLLSIQNIPPAAASSWLQNYAAAAISAKASLPLSLAGNRLQASNGVACAPWTQGAMPSTPSQWLLPNTVEAALKAAANQ